MGIARTALQQYVADHGSEIRVAGKVLNVVEVSTAGEVAMATITCGRSFFLGILCDRERVDAHPGAEVWRLDSASKSIAKIAVTGGNVIQIKGSSK